jgi:hypothetical protein
MEIKLELDTGKESKAVVAIAAAYGICRVSADNEYPQPATANAIAIIIIIAILYGPRPAPKKNVNNHGRSMLHGASHNGATCPQRDQTNDPSNQQK